MGRRLSSVDEIVLDVSKLFFSMCLLFVDVFIYY